MAALVRRVEAAVRLAVFLGRRWVYALAVAAILVLSDHLPAALTAAPRGRGDLGLFTATGSVIAAAVLNLAGIVAAMSATVPTLVSERRSCDRQCRSTGRKHPFAHGNSPFEKENQRKTGSFPRSSQRQAGQASSTQSLVRRDTAMNINSAASR
jgi:hypothetical protein